MVRRGNDHNTRRAGTVERRRVLLASNRHASQGERHRQLSATAV